MLGKRTISPFFQGGLALFRVRQLGDISVLSSLCGPPIARRADHFPALPGHHLSRFLEGNPFTVSRMEFENHCSQNIKLVYRGDTSVHQSSPAVVGEIVLDHEYGSCYTHLGIARLPTLLCAGIVPAREFAWRTIGNHG